METIQEISIDMIDDPQNAMRTEIDRNGLWELADNIKQNGLINPITVRPKGERYEVVAGHRRLSACKIAGKIKIQCVVRDLDDNKTFEVMASENLERQDVDPVDEAIFISQFIEQTGKTVAEVAKSLRRSVAYVESRLSIGMMPDYLQGYLKTSQLKLGVALALAQIDNDNIRRVWTEQAVRDGVSVAQAEYWLHGYRVNKLPGGELSEEPPEGYTPDAPSVVLFTCFVDGKKYDARLFRSVMIYEKNLPLLEEIVAEIRKSDDITMHPAGQ